MSWKYVTDHNGAKHMINLDQVADMVRIANTTQIYFSNGKMIEVPETPNDIAMADPLRVK